MNAQERLWTLAGMLALLAIAAAFAEHSRTRRRDLDRVGWMPWNLIQIMTGLGAVVAAALALKG